jgi:hypothetical protein
LGGVQLRLQRQDTGILSGFAKPGLGLFFLQLLETDVQPVNGAFEGFESS